jgi:hypothetical protein
MIARLLRDSRAFRLNSAAASHYGGRCHLRSRPSVCLPGACRRWWLIVAILGLSLVVCGPVPLSAATGFSPATALSANATQGSTHRCPLNAKELSVIFGGKVALVVGANPSCNFADVAHASLKNVGLAKFGVMVLFTPQSVKGARIYAKNHLAQMETGTKIVNRPDLGAGAFMLVGPSLRGASATFGRHGGTVFVGVALGFTRKGVNTKARDRAVANKIFRLVHGRLGI